VLDYVHQEYVDEQARHYLAHLRTVAPQALRVTDKHPGNAHLLGLIAILVPRARIIDLRRDPMDNGLACFSTDLGRRHCYSRDLTDFGQYYRDHERLMRHWSEVLDLPMLSVRYRDLVRDQEDWTRRIIDFCGLDWHDDCMRFHEVGERAQRRVQATQSFDQVRQPMYTSSVDRARPFIKHLKPLERGLEAGRQYWRDRDGSVDEA
jgi:hypothetical protein